MRNSIYYNTSIEDSVTIRAVRRVYAKEAGLVFEDAPQPFDIYEIAMGRKEGNKAAALASWEEFAIVLADAIANAVTLVDGIVVIGGGLSGAWPVFMPTLLKNSMNLLSISMATLSQEWKFRLIICKTPTKWWRLLPKQAK